jgi:hypothetical protein
MMVTSILLLTTLTPQQCFYENKSNDKKERAFLELKLKGPAKNINAIGNENNRVCKRQHKVI